jgi:hypothetical protein
MLKSKSLEKRIIGASQLKTSFCPVPIKDKKKDDKCDFCKYRFMYRCLLEKMQKNFIHHLLVQNHQSVNLCCGHKI